MKPDDFEKRLARQTFRQPPPEWREEILGAVSKATSSHPSTSDPQPSWLSTFNHQLSTLLWPHPKAWAGLAAVWVLIFVINFAGRDETQSMAKKSPPPSPEMVAALREQHRLFVELVGRTEPQDAERPRIAPPRSERRVELVVA